MPAHIQVLATAGSGPPRKEQKAVVGRERREILKLEAVQWRGQRHGGLTHGMLHGLNGKLAVFELALRPGQVALAFGSYFQQLPVGIEGRLVLAVAQGQVAQQLVLRGVGRIDGHFAQAVVVGLERARVVANGFEQRPFQQVGLAKRWKLIVQLVQGFNGLDEIPLFDLLLGFFQQVTGFGVGWRRHPNGELAPGRPGGGQPQQTHHSEAQRPQH